MKSRQLYVALALAGLSSSVVAATRPTSINFTQGSITRSLPVPSLSAYGKLQVQYTETLNNGQRQFKLGGQWVQFAESGGPVTSTWVYPAPPTCPPIPADVSQTLNCADTNPGTTGTWTQTHSWTQSPYPGCVNTPTPWLPLSAPAGSCQTPPPPGGHLAFNYTPDQSSPEFQRWKQIVDSGDHDDMSAIDLAFMYKFTGDESYAQKARDLADQQVTAYEQACGLSATRTAIKPILSEAKKERIRKMAGVAPLRYQNRVSAITSCSPEVAGDSYLYAGDLLADVITTYAWANPTASQKQRWAAYINQVAFNIWNPDDASFGGSPAPWSGWSINDPINNYFYRSFAMLSMMWAATADPQNIVHDGKTLKQYMLTDRIPLLQSAYAAFSGGGSPEGTGYGQSHMQLFELYKWWKDSTGQNLANAHETNSLHFWLHSVTTDRIHLWPIGSQARVSSAPMNDYPLKLMELAYFETTDAAAKNAGCYFFNYVKDEDGRPYLTMHNRFMARWDTIGSRACTPTLPPLTYYAPEVGALMARTSWTDANAAWVGILMGDYSQSHAHPGQGSFAYSAKGKWLTVTNNMNSNSGIEGEGGSGRAENVVAFYKGGTEQPQQRGHRTQVTTHDQNPVTGEEHVLGDMTSLYASNSGVNVWKRQQDFVNGVLTVTDNVQVASGTTAKAQINTFGAPPTCSGTICTAPGLKVTVLAPSAPVFTIVNLRNVDSDFNSGAYRIDITCSTGCKYELKPSP